MQKPPFFLDPRSVQDMKLFNVRYSSHISQAKLGTMNFKNIQELKSLGFVGFNL